MGEPRGRESDEHDADTHRSKHPSQFELGRFGGLTVNVIHIRPSSRAMPYPQSFVAMANPLRRHQYHAPSSHDHSLPMLRSHRLHPTHQHCLAIVLLYPVVELSKADDADVRSIVCRLGDARSTSASQRPLTRVPGRRQIKGQIRARP